MTLTHDRQVGISAGGIPFSSIDQFARRYGIDDLDEFDRFHTLIRAMDAEFRKAPPIGGTTEG